MSAYLLDTSALRALSGGDLQRLIDHGIHLYSSPYCFWELVCHLDEHHRFERWKAELMKFRYIEILDDPQAIFENSLSLVDKERVPDNDIIEASLGALQAASSLENFYSSYIRDTRDNTRQISECALRVREALDLLEEKYVEFVSKIINRLDSIEKNLEDHEVQNQLILSLVEGEVMKLTERGILRDTLRKETIDNTYVYYSYIFFRALKYFNNKKVRVDKNDFEDANICKHLKIDTSYCFITGDKGTLEAVKQAIFLLQHVEELKTKTTLRVEDVAFLQRIARPCK